MKTGMILLPVILTILAANGNAEAGASLTGTVRDPQGRPVSGTAVTLSSLTGAAGGATTSDAAGVYRFTGLPEGDYLLRAEAPGLAIFLAGGIHLSATREIVLELAGVREKVVVTASSTSQLPEEVSKAIAVIDQANSDARGDAAVADAVALAPGVRVQTLGGPGAFATIQIRGLRTEDTAVLVDGLRLRDASATQADASGLIEDLLLTDASRIEVMRGSGSSLYGTNAIGGVVNVITDEGGGRTRGSLLLEGGSLGLMRARAGSLPEDSTTTGFSRSSLGLAETDVTSGVGGDAPFRNASAQGRLTFHLWPSVRLIARFYAADSFSKVLGEPALLGNPSGNGIVNAIPLPSTLVRLYQDGTPLGEINTGNATFIQAPDDPDYTRASRFVSGALILDGQASPSLDYSVSYQLVSNGRRYGDGPAGVVYQPSSSTRSLYDGRIQTVDAQAHYRPGRWNLLSGGYEFESETYANDNTQQYIPAAASSTDVTQQSQSVFAQDQVKLFRDSLQISLAGRAQFFTLDSPAFLPIASSPYQGITFPSPSPAYTGDASVAYFLRASGTKLHAHAGRGYRAPSLFERFGTEADS